MCLRRHRSSTIRYFIVLWFIYSKWMPITQQFAWSPMHAMRWTFPSLIRRTVLPSLALASDPCTYFCPTRTRRRGMGRNATWRRRRNPLAAEQPERQAAGVLIFVYFHGVQSSCMVVIGDSEAQQGQESHWCGKKIRILGGFVLQKHIRRRNSKEFLSHCA